MASIKNMELSKELFSKNFITVHKSFFGLCTKVVYNPTGSEVKGFSHEYATEPGQRIEALLNTDPSLLEKAIDGIGKIEKSDIGTMRLDGCISDDRQFAAFQLFTYSQYLYKPLTEVKIYEGHAAEVMSKLF